MPISRRDLGVDADSNGKVYAFGGHDGNGNFLGILQVYDPQNDSWITKSPLSLARNAMGFTYSPSNGRFYVAGGFNNGTLLRDFYEYDPISDHWTEKAQMSIARFGLSLVAGNNNKLYAIGGSTSDATCITTIEEYDLNSNSWSTKTPIPTGRCMSSAITTSDGKIYVVGGHTSTSIGPRTELNTVETYNPENDSWTIKSPIIYARSNITLVLNRNKNIYAIGGNIAGPDIAVLPSDIVEEYDFQNNTWVVKSPLPVGLDASGGATGIDGKVYIVGGQTLNLAAVSTNYVGFTPQPPSLILDVPIFKQTDQSWKNQTYDNAQKWSPSSKTIEKWGCALTSATMVLNFHGINKLPNGTSLNPGTLNTWLKNQKDGYVGTGWVNWLAISRLSKLSKTINNIVDFDALEFVRFGSANKNQLKTDLEHSIPDILEEPGHFVVATGYEGDIFKINDPYFDKNTLNDGYSNTFLSLTSFVPSETNLSYIMLTVNPDINLVVKDLDGNIVGESFIQQPLTEESNPSLTNSPIRIFYLPKPENQEYTIEISSSENKAYDLNILLYDQNGNVNKISQPGLISENQNDGYVIKFNKENSNNSKAVKQVSFQTLLDDINEGRKLKLISPFVAENLIKLLKDAQKNMDKNKKLAAKLELTLMEEVIKPLKNTLVKEPAYSVLLNDLKLLKGSL
ncbi:MAG: C39 family peptidase [Candidatus Levybacteria bacterium]|nr:C39 family peptidase [Candidatus Levybacteria bacterium]